MTSPHPDHLLPAGPAHLTEWTGRSGRRIRLPLRPGRRLRAPGSGYVPPVLRPERGHRFDRWGPVHLRGGAGVFGEEER